jgi:2,5-diketo-D-gluconate reductase A
VIAQIAAKHGATPAQVVIAWHLAIGNVVIPKSVTESRIRENYAALEVTLDETDVQAINALDNSAEGAGRIGPDPAVSDFA